MSAISRSKGFTLIEVLIAVGLLSILTAALYGSYFGVIRGRDRASSGMESRRELSSTLDQIRREVASLIPVTTGTISDQLKPRLIVEDRDYFGLPSSTLTLTTQVPSTGYLRKESGVVTVTYQIEEKGGRRILTRQERDIFSEEKTVPSFPQMEQISSFLVECYDGSKWIKTWNTTVNGRRPTAVRVTVQVEDEGKKVEFSTLATPQVSGL